MSETLTDRANRAKARWLKRMMNSPNLTSTQKTLAYAICDHLNCVTLDCWPSQNTLARALGCSSSKTVQRASNALQAFGVIVVTRQKGGSIRYAPVFVVEDWDIPGRVSGQTSARKPDSNVPQSNLSITLRPSSTGADRASEVGQAAFKLAERGQWETAVANRLGQDGWDILMRLNELDVRVVDRLCASQAEGTLGERELNAARLAAKQMR